MAKRICVVDGCGRAVKGHGWCAMHYQRWRVHGDPLYVRPRYETCRILGCDKPTRSPTAEWCEMHYGRWRRHGDPARGPIYGKPVRQSAGYIILYKPGHPLADRWGLVYEHRMVLYDAIGPGPHECFWCGSPIDWRVGRRIDVDHLDGTRDNNARDNLVPSCRGCNFGRSGGRPERSALFLATRRLIATHRAEFDAMVEGYRQRLGATRSTADDEWTPVNTAALVCTRKGA